MAFFDFVKGTGNLVSAGLTAAAGAVKEEDQGKTLEAIEGKIKGSKVVNRDLSMRFTEDHCVKVYAVVESADDKDNLILMVGNTPGVSKVEDAIKVRPPGATADVKTPAPRFYQVKSGDTLGSIAEAELGDESRYTEIFQANRNILSNPDQIDVGQTLRIPK